MVWPIALDDNAVPPIGGAILEAANCHEIPRTQRLALYLLAQDFVEKPDGSEMAGLRLAEDRNLARSMRRLGLFKSDVLANKFVVYLGSPRLWSFVVTVELLTEALEFVDGTVGASHRTHFFLSVVGAVFPRTHINDYRSNRPERPVFAPSAVRVRRPEPSIPTRGASHGDATDGVSSE